MKKIIYILCLVFYIGLPLQSSQAAMVVVKVCQYVSVGGGEPYLECYDTFYDDGSGYVSGGGSGGGGGGGWGDDTTSNAISCTESKTKHEACLRTADDLAFLAGTGSGLVGIEIPVLGIYLAYESYQAYQQAKDNCNEIRNNELSYCTP